MQEVFKIHYESKACYHNKHSCGAGFIEKYRIDGPSK